MMLIVMNCDYGDDDDCSDGDDDKSLFFGMFSVMKISSNNCIKDIP